VELYDKLIASNPAIERKGKTMPYTSVNGHMFSFLDKEGEMGLRLSKQGRNEFIEKYKTKLSVQHGAVMKEYVVVPNDLLQDLKTLSDYLQESYEYVSGLKPKSQK
jgi:hypothetical protein